MRCQRCKGLMVVEYCLDDEFKEQLAGRGVLRCVNCGAMVTVRMLRNLVARQREVLKASTSTGAYARHAKRTVGPMGVHRTTSA